MAEWSYNIAYHAFAKILPFEALYGYLSPKLLTYVLGTTSNDTVDSMLKNREKILSML